jgi:hypothetical protein
MNPFHANRLASVILANARCYDKAVVSCARRVKFNFWSMILAAFCCSILFISLAWGLKCFSKAILWHQNQIPFFFNMPGMFLFAVITAFLLSMLLFFHTGKSRDMALILTSEES